MSYCMACKVSGGCIHSDKQYPYEPSAELGRLERERNALKNRVDSLEAQLSDPTFKVPVKKFVDDETLSWEERFRRLEDHHFKETNWLINELKRAGK